MQTKPISALVLLAAIGACAGNSPPDTGSTVVQSAAASTARVDRDLITQQELSTSSVSGLSVLEAVKTLRPHFLTVRGLHTVPIKDANGTQVVDEEAGKVHAAIDGNKIVALDELNGIRAGTVFEVRYFNAGAAMQKFGATAREGPVIFVKTMK
jgi:hypothetical protein